MIGPVNPLTVLVAFNSVSVDDKLTWERMHSGGPMPSDLNANTIYHTVCVPTRLKDTIGTAIVEEMNIDRTRIGRSIPVSAYASHLHGNNLRTNGKR